MPVKLLSLGGLIVFFTLTSQLIFAQVLEVPNFKKMCTKELKDQKKIEISTIKELYKIEKRRLSHPKNSLALRAARINRETDIDTAKDTFRTARKECVE